MTVVKLFRFNQSPRSWIIYARNLMKFSWSLDEVDVSNSTRPVPTKANATKISTRVWFAFSLKVQCHLTHQLSPSLYQNSNSPPQKKALKLSSVDTISSWWMIPCYYATWWKSCFHSVSVLKKIANFTPMSQHFTAGAQRMNEKSC